MQPDERISNACLLVAVALCLTTPARADRDAGRSHEVEIYRYEVAPTVVLGPRAKTEMTRTPFGKLGVDAYLVVIRLNPGERFVSARAEMRDGFICKPRRGRGKKIAGKIATYLGSKIVFRSAAPKLSETIALVSELVPLNTDSAIPTPGVRRRMVLKPEDVVHQEGYVAVLLVAAAGPFTRLEVVRIVTRPAEGRGKQTRGRGQIVAFPDITDEPMTGDRIRSIMAGKEQDFSSR
ncbi:MAG: hypothetical protein OEV00_09775 [Acidobacteriota bacterium]|nr:hypothetical protein [Acidobacteriota bacterium]MDH3785599.1 hypothetical protein [Acidobacteriota bacterium]